MREQREVTAEMPETVLTHRLMKVITAGAGAGAAEDGTGSARLGRARSDNTAAVKAAAAAARLAAPISGTVTDLEVRRPFSLPCDMRQSYADSCGFPVP